MKKAVIKVLLIALLFIFPTFVYANIMCNDGTTSPTCTDCHRGCCSRHGGCATDYTPPANNEPSQPSEPEPDEEPVVEDVQEETQEETVENTYEDDTHYEDEEDDVEEESSNDDTDVFSTILGLIGIGGIGYGIAKKRRK